MKKIITNVIFFIVLIPLTVWFSLFPDLNPTFNRYPTIQHRDSPIRITSHPDLPFVVNDRVTFVFDMNETIYRGVFFQYYLLSVSSRSISIVTDNGDEYSLRDALSIGIVTIYEAFQSGLDVHRRISPNPEFIFWTVLLLIFAYTQISKLVNLTFRGGNPPLSSLKRFQARPSRGG